MLLLLPARSCRLSVQPRDPADHAEQFWPLSDGQLGSSGCRRSHCQPHFAPQDAAAAAEYR